MPKDGYFLFKAFFQSHGSGSASLRAATLSRHSIAIMASRPIPMPASFNYSERNCSGENEKWEYRIPDAAVGNQQIAGIP